MAFLWGCVPPGADAFDGGGGDEQDELVPSSCQDRSAQNELFTGRAIVSRKLSPEAGPLPIFPGDISMTDSASVWHARLLPQTMAHAV